jgi:hypothetical protein
LALDTVAALPFPSLAWTISLVSTGVNREVSLGSRHHPGGVDPDKPFFVSAKAEKLVCRGPREYYMVGKMPDGSEAEAQLTAVRWDELRSLATFRITRPS